MHTKTVFSFSMKALLAAFPAFGIQLNNITCHRQQGTSNIWRSTGFLDPIPGCYYCILHRCGVDVMKSLEGGIKKSYMSCAAQKHIERTSVDMLRTQGPKKISKPVKVTFVQIQDTSIRAIFKRIRYIKSQTSFRPSAWTSTPFSNLKADDR